MLLYYFALNTFCLLTFKQQLNCDFQLFGAACVGLEIKNLQLVLENSLLNNTNKSNYNEHIIIKAFTANQKYNQKIYNCENVTSSDPI